MAAGQGFKTFTTGEVLTAGDVNGYLMQGVLVFASAAARDAAITSPQEGQFAFTKDTNGLWYYDGAAWVASGATGDIEGVTAGVGISGGGTSGTVTVTNSMATAIDAKGDLVAGTGADTFAKLTVGANGTILTADSAEATGLKWAAAAGGGGKVLQVVTATTNTLTQVASTSFTDSGLSLSITPSASSSKVLVLISQSSQVTAYNPTGATTTSFGTVRLVRTSTELTSNIMQGGFAKASDSEASMILTNSFVYLDSPSTTSATTYKTQGKVADTSNSQQINFQRTSAGYSTIALLEIGA